mgnify:CR=1 FL=1
MPWPRSARAIDMPSRTSDGQIEGAQQSEIVNLGGEVPRSDDRRAGAGAVAAYALGLTPLVFVIAGVIFACTTMTYAEGTVRFPEAGGSSSVFNSALNAGVESMCTSSMMKTLKRSRAGAKPIDPIIVSRTFST